MKNLFVKKMMKVRKGFSLPEILVACAIIVALSVGAFFGFNQAQQTRKIAQMHNEMDALATACLTYESLNIDGDAPSALTDLITGLTAAKSIDGAAHTNFITSSRDTTSGILDPWGNAYGYSQSTRTISCIPKDTSGADMDAVEHKF